MTKSVSRAELRSALVDRKPEDHKGVFGHVLVVGGSRGMLGAPLLAARAALRSGAGLVTLAVPASIQPFAATLAPEAMTLALPESSSGALRSDAVARLRAAHRERHFTTLALGPGLSRQPDAEKLTVLVLSAIAIPTVIDADALNALAAQDSAGVRELLRKRGAPCIFTPHPGEMARCLGITNREVQDHREDSAQRLARDWGGVALLKGHKTVISSGSRTVLNATGGPGLAKGGSGDVLTGVIAALWAQLLASGRATGDAAFAAAALGAHLHGLAGESAEKAKTAWSVLASDVVEHLPDAFRALSS
jgi:NAD(P)H-hydrate epimerase